MRISSQFRLFFCFPWQSDDALCDFIPLHTNIGNATVYDRIRNDDVSIAEFFARFTLAQIRDFINIAVKNNCTNVSAVLLDYKHRTFNDFDPMDAFALEW